MDLFQYPQGTTYGLSPTTVDIFCYTAAAQADSLPGEVRQFDLRLGSADATDLVEGHAASGWAVLVNPETSNAGTQWGFFGVTLEAKAAGGLVKTRVKGRCRIYVANDGGSAANKGTPNACFALPTVRYLNCDTTTPATGLNDNFKALALLLEDCDAAEDGTNRFEVLFDGLSGFGAFAA